MKKYDSKVSIVMEYLEDHNYSNSVIWLHRTCYSQLKEYLTKTSQEYSLEQAMYWVDSHESEWNYRQICGYKHCIYQLNDIYLLGQISLDHVSFQSSAYANLISGFSDITDRFINEVSITDTRYKHAVSRFLMYLQNNGITSIEELNYKIIIDFHNNDYHSSSRSKDVYESLIRKFLQYLATINFCDIGLSLALNKMIIHKILIVKDSSIFNIATNQENIYPDLIWDDINNYLYMLNEKKYGSTVLKSSRHILTLLYIFIDMYKLHISDELVWMWFEMIKPKLGCCWKQHRRTLCQFLHFLKYNEIITSMTGNPQSIKSIDMLPEWERIPFLSYLELLKKEGFCPSTIAMHKSSNLRFCSYLTSLKITNFKEVTPEIVKNFNLQDKHDTPEGKAAYNCRIRSFLIYLYEKGFINNSYLYNSLPINASNRKAVVQTLSSEEIAKIWSIDIDSLNPKAMRDYAILIIGLTMGFRSSDILSLCFEDINWKECSISIVQQKTGKIIRLPMPVKTGNIVYRYIRDSRPKSDEPYVFIRHEAPYDKLQRGVCRSALKRFLDLNPSDNCYFHTVRKTFASQLLTGHTELNIITESLGHRTDTTVHKYLSLDEARMKACALSLSDANISYKGGAYRA